MTAATRARVLLRACPRCSGDLFPDEDNYACLQCGRSVAVECAIGPARVDSVLESAMGRNRERRRRSMVAPPLEVGNDAA